MRSPLGPHRVEGGGGEVELHGVADVERDGQAAALGPLPATVIIASLASMPTTAPVGPTSSARRRVSWARPAAEVESPVAGAEAQLGHGHLLGWMTAGKLVGLVDEADEVVGVGLLVDPSKTASRRWQDACLASGPGLVRSKGDQMDVRTLMRRSAGFYADQEAVVHADVRLTFAAGLGAGPAAGQRLLALGLEPGDGSGCWRTTASRPRRLSRSHRANLVRVPLYPRQHPGGPRHMLGTPAVRR